MRVLMRNAGGKAAAGGLRQISRHGADFERVRQPGADGIVGLKRKNMRLVL